MVRPPSPAYVWGTVSLSEGDSEDQRRATGGDECQERGGQEDRHVQERETDGQVIDDTQSQRQAASDAAAKILASFVINFLILWQDQFRFRLCVVTVGLST